MKILLVNNQLQLGGAETVAHQLQAGLRAAGDEAELAVAFGRSYPPDVRPLYPRTLSRLDHSRLHRLIERLAPRNAWTDRAFRRLAGSRADLIHVHNFHGDYASVESLAFLAAHKPIVWTFHGFWGITGGCDHPGDCEKFREACGECPLVHEWPINGVDNTAAELVRKIRVLGPAPLNVVAPSLHLARKVRDSRVGRRWRVEHIPNGVDTTAFHPGRKGDAAFRRETGVDPARICVLVVNRNFREPLKGFATIQAALRMLPPANLQVVLVGDHADWGAAQLPAHHSPTPAGYLSDRKLLARWYEIADVFLYASPRENFPCVILEAMAAQCCVVATPTDGVVEQIQDGISGVVADEISGPALGAALQRALADPTLRARTAEAARTRVSRDFNEALFVERHRQLYAGILNTWRPRA